ncbi:helix-turn-helix domain-containing protein [Streptacidiphilus sp. MAP5-52]|uniref:helix-turn-helix domain-containing protein n=1 Tax=Streptacidiphilus sp. MAP5-52 TaxID=3156267 RepID=UPI0035128AA9
MRGLSEHLSIGERIAWYRHRRGLSQEVLAGLVGRTADWLSKIENGRIELDRLSVIKGLAAALDVQIGDLLGEPLLLDWTAEVRGKTVPALREALMDYRSLSPLLAGTPEPRAKPDIGLLRAGVGNAWAAYQHARYAHATRLIPGILATSQHAASVLARDQQLQALSLLALTYQSAAAVLTKIGEGDAAWLASDRGLAAAQQSGDPVVIGSLFRAVSHCLLANGRYAAARDLIRSGADYLEDGLAEATPAYLSVYGTLLLVGAMAAARGEERSTAEEFLAEAECAAERLGHDANHMWTAFGPTNVAIHRVSIAMELGDVQIALDHGPRVDTSTLPIERRVRHSLEVARAYHARNRTDEALSLILDAEELAPEQVRHHQIPRALVATWVRNQRGRPAVPLAGLAHRLHVMR